MKQEQLQVLEMVAAGTLTPQQGAELLDALIAEPARTSSGPEESGREAPIRKREQRGRLTRFSPDELVRLRDHGVEPCFLREIDALDLGTPSVDQLIHLADHDVAPSFVREVYNLGFSTLSIDDIIQLAEHDVDAAFLREIYDLGFSDLRIDQIVELRDHDVDADFLRALVETSPVAEADHRD